MGDRQLTVNTCFVNAPDVLKPPCVAATVASSNPTRQRPITFVYQVLRARGTNYYNSIEQITHCGIYASRETAMAAAFTLATREQAADKAELFLRLPAPSSPRFAHERANAEIIANEYYKDLEKNEDGLYKWGVDCETGPGCSVRVHRDVLLP